MVSTAFNLSSFNHPLEKLVAPLVQAVVAVCRLLVVGACQVFDPVDEEILVLLQDQELSKDHVRLKSGGQI